MGTSCDSSSLEIFSSIVIFFSVEILVAFGKRRMAVVLGRVICRFCSLGGHGSSVSRVVSGAILFFLQLQLGIGQVRFVLCNGGMFAQRDHPTHDLTSSN